MNSRLAAGLATCTIALGAASTGCVGSTQLRGEVVFGHPAYAVDVENVPVEIAIYPHVLYRGSWAYLVGDAWYYQAPHGWVVFREEPRELQRSRAAIEPREVERTRKPIQPTPPREYRRRYYER